ncbi:cell division protein FtsN [Rahnella variigena]|uniref:cell division protein FtsN n=1 Tax=Rahnella variigena TaxID=574964 RepID=UPI000DEBDC35|nr:MULTISPECIES: cell division protein FtsN [Rahnella]RBQ33890.1 cell division protein FtsN [Rahnella aquatilis]RYJ16160.1 cell division protein FtsN [Rahnella variigena]
MAQRDYVSRGRSGARRKSTSRSKKRSSPTISKTMVVLAVAVLVVFVGGLYFIAHNKHEEAVVLPTHPVRPGNGLPPKPEERWRYIKELENRQMGVTTPTEPTAGGQVESKTQLTPEQRQLLEQMQADMRQTPTQLSEVPYNDPNQATQAPARTQRQVQQQQPTYAQQQPVQTQPRQVQQPVRAPQAQVQTQAVQPKPKPQVKEPVKEVPKEVAKPQQPAAITQVAPEKPKAQEKTQHFVVQCGSFKGSEQAESQRAKLAFEGFEGRITTGGGWSRVVIGPYNSRSGADSTLSRLKGAGISGCIPVATGG